MKSLSNYMRLITLSGNKFTPVLHKITQQIYASYYLTLSSNKFNPHLLYIKSLSNYTCLIILLFQVTRLTPTCSVIAVVQMVQSKKTRWTREVTMSHEIESEIWHIFDSLGVILAELGQGRSRNQKRGWNGHPLSLLNS